MLGRVAVGGFESLGEQHDLAEAAPAVELALLRSIALALAEAEAAGTPLPARLADSLGTWLQGGWLAGEAPDRDFAQGYLAGLEAAARHCETAAERRLAERRLRWSPLRRRGLGRWAAQLRSVAGNLRLMARGVRPQAG
jgi:hypothetical protein